MSKRKTPESSLDDAAPAEDVTYTFDDSSVDKLSQRRAGTTPLDTSAFAFFIISKGRPDNVSRMEALFEGSGARPTWVVGAGEVASYRDAGAQSVVEGGKLCPSRNLALDSAATHNKVCVQLSDDLHHLEYLEHKADGDFSKEKGKGKKGARASAVGWMKPLTQQESNARSQGSVEHRLSPVGAARLCEAFMRGAHFEHTAMPEATASGGGGAAGDPGGISGFGPSSFLAETHVPRSSGSSGGAGDWLFPNRRPKLAGAYPCMNAGFAFNAPPVQSEHFVVGDFIVVDVRSEAAPTTASSSCSKGAPAAPSHLRFDERMLLKEDYDFTCQHLETYGNVCRLNRLFVKAEHRVNAGGAVDDRNAPKEKKMIALLREKWPGVFKGHRRPLEVSMLWRTWHPFFGVRIARRFPQPAAASAGAAGSRAGGSKVYVGQVVRFFKPRDDDDEELWNVEYEDGDVEDLDRAELLDAISLFKDLHPNGEAQPRPNLKEGFARSLEARIRDFPEEAEEAKGGSDGESSTITGNVKKMRAENKSGLVKGLQHGNSEADDPDEREKAMVA